MEPSKNTSEKDNTFTEEERSIKNLGGFWGLALFSLGIKC